MPRQLSTIIFSDYTARSITIEIIPHRYSAVGICSTKRIFNKLNLFYFRWNHFSIKVREWMCVFTRMSESFYSYTIYAVDVDKISSAQRSCSDIYQQQNQHTLINPSNLSSQAQSLCRKSCSLPSAILSTANRSLSIVSGELFSQKGRLSPFMLKYMRFVFWLCQ